MCSACSLHFDGETRGRRSLEQVTYQHGATSVANRAHCRRNPRGKKERGSRGGNCLKGCMLAVPRCSGGF
jgi:hypothetical protein